LLNPDLSVRGFGVEITVAGEPDSLRLAADADAEDTIELPYTRWGTRHRSMMRYCWAVPNSVGFVLSQDGDVRAMTREDDALVVWENPLLQLEIDAPS
jgi:hypothetical protein